jgi:ADP-heptose:LPS heptosyltransferase
MTSSLIPIPNCKHFTGYKPCFPGENCLQECVQCEPIGTKILIINLDAMGNVLVTTALLPALKRKYPESTIYWITLKNAAPLLQENPLIDRVYLWEAESWLILGQMSFDLVLNVDKSQRSCALTMSLRCAERRGFGLNEDGTIIPLNPGAIENYQLGLDDHLKFHVNQKTVPQLQCEQFGLEFKRDDYILVLTPEEKAFCEDYKHQNGLADGSPVVGFNTGCSELYPNKKMTVDQHVELITQLTEAGGLKLVLLGGPEDTVRNAEIARRVGNRVVSTPTTEGVRRGLCYINVCDIVISGDSFGMHAAIGLKKEIVVWFGVSCWTEIDLFDRGIKLIPEGLACSPCWKRVCPFNLECIERIDLSAIVHRVKDYRSRRAGIAAGQ